MAKKRGNGEGSIGCYNGRWVGRIVMPDGKRKAVYGASRAEVSRKLARLVRDRDIGLPAPDDRLTIGNYLESWLVEHVKPRSRPSTYRSYESHVRVHLIPAFGALSLARLTPRHIERLMAEKSASGLSPATVNRIRATLRCALARAEKQGLVQRNVAALADALRVQPKLVEPLTQEQAQIFLSVIQGHRHETLFVVALATGMRQGEILGLQWHDVDLDAKRLFVRHALQRVEGKPILIEPKTARSRRFIALAPSVTRQIQAQRDRYNQIAAEHGDDWNPMMFVFPSTHGTPLDGHNVTRSFQAALDGAGLPHMRFHDLRHTCASFLLAQGASMRVIMEQLGHSQISLTMNTYSHVMPEAMHDAAALMENIFSEVES